MSWLTKALRPLFPSLPKSRSRRQTDDYVARIRKSLGATDFSQLAEKYPDARWKKYIDLDTFVPYHLQNCRLLGLIGGPKQFILDIGCGGGLFLYCAKYFGHDGLGIDVENPLLAEMAEAYGVKRLVAPVRKFEALAVEGTFDLVTAINTNFDRGKIGRGQPRGYWGADEWRFFFTDIRNHLSTNGRVFLRINRDPTQPQGQYYYNERLHRALAHGHLRRADYLFDRAGLDRAIANLGETA